jgi:hypothetical protein
MDDRLITMAVLIAALVLALSGGAYYFVRFRLAKKEAVRERLGRYAAERRETVASERLGAVNGYVAKILNGTPHKAPSKLWSVKAFGWLAGLVTGAWAAARTAPVSGGATATAAVSAKAVAVTGLMALAGAGGIAYTVYATPTVVNHQPPAAIGLPHQSSTPRRTIAPSSTSPPPVTTTPPATTEAPTSTPTLTPTPTLTVTMSSPALSRPRTAPNTTGDAPVTAPSAPAASVDAAPTPEAPADTGTTKGHPVTPPVETTPAPTEPVPAETGKDHPARHGLCEPLHPVLDLLGLCGG